MLNYREGNYDIRSFFDTTKNGIRLFVILGNVLYALTVKLFLLPADLVTGGTTGIGLAVNHYTGLSISGFVLVFNIIMLLCRIYHSRKTICTYNDYQYVCVSCHAGNISASSWGCCSN